MADAAWPLSKIMNHIPPDQAPLKYYLLHIFLYFSRSEFLISCPGFLFDLASILVLFYLGRLLFGKKAALLASFFMAVSPWLIQYAMQARNYPLYTFSVLTSTFFLYRGTQSLRLRDWVFFGVAAAFGFYSFYPSVFILAAQLCWFFLCYGRRGDLIKRLCLSLGLFLVIIAPALSQLVKGFDFKVTGPLLGSRGLMLWKVVGNHFSGITGPYPFGILIFILSFIWLIYFQKKKRQALLLALLVIMPICFYAICSSLFHASLSPRNFLHIYPFFLLMAAAGILSWRHWVARAVGIFVFILPLCLYCFFQAGLIKRSRIPYEYLRHNSGLDVFLSLLKQNYDALDFVVVIDARTIFGIQYYLDKANRFPAVELSKNSEGGRYFMYANSEPTIYGIDDDLPLLKYLANAGRLLVMDFVNNNNPAIISWLRSNAYRVDREGSTKFYFISPPISVLVNKNSSALARRELLRESRVLRHLIYPFNRKEWALHEN